MVSQELLPSSDEEEFGVMSTMPLAAIESYYGSDTSGLRTVSHHISMRQSSTRESVMLRGSPQVCLGTKFIIAHNNEIRALKIPFPKICFKFC